MSLNRHQIRELAFQTLFAINANKETDKEAFFHVIVKDDQAEYPDYLCQLVDGVLAHQPELDSQISEYLSAKWSIDRIAKVDLIILRIAFYEHDYVDDIPDKVAVNEAIELTKKYSDDRSRRFVSGVLSHVVSG
ncbi:transcription antitermination factor NusB [Nicoliella spurrieriana]|uniref:Transcription antitermination protein NusB n=1 Tax=Nicoliella spurrieriana TaxID=2925830 RepID=A0A976X5G7_9LACO|nr:transcription antitermination factor NusB [Nicoliella spurrieriana]UQS86654.1 transcription antitermination factor NusB [Nicoliella spurrieriana]